MKRLLPLALLAVAACSGENSPAAICDAALLGAFARDQHVECQRRVWRAQHTAGYAAAQPYRELPR